VFEVGALTEPQQDAIARKLAGSPGEMILDRARRSTGLADLIENPFYLTALITTYAGGELPSTKDSILRAFVARVEANKAAPLQALLDGFHAEYLKAIAVSLQKARRVSLDEYSAVSSLFVAGETLVHRRLLRNAGEPRDVLNALVDHHVLVRSGPAPDSSLAFQHQLFQEWYASFYVEQQMRDASAGDPGVAQQLIAESLNQPWWEEAVLFGCERASRREEMLPTVAATIRSALMLDTRFAADIISRSSDSAWDLVRADVVSLVEKWLREGALARALEFMYASGRPDFAEHVWPLISAPDQQRRLGVLRCDRLTTTVLGSSAKERVLSLPEEIAVDVLGELCFSGGAGEFDFAVDVARQASPTIIVNVAGALAFRGARRHLHVLLRDTPPAVWDRMARTNHFDSILEPGFAERLWSARNSLLAAAATSLERLRLRVLGATHPDSPAVHADVALAEFPESLERSAYELLAALSKRFLDEVRQGLIERLVAGRPIPSSCDALLEGALCEDPGLARMLQDSATPWHIAEAVSATLAEPLVSSLVDAYLSTLRKEPSSSTREQYDRLRTLLAAVPADRLVNVLATRPPETSPDAVGALAELVARVGRGDEERRQPLSPDLKPKALPLLQAWADVMLASADASGSNMVNVAMCIGRSGWTELTDSLIALVDRDTARFRRERAEQKLAFARRDQAILVTISYGHQFADAFVGLAGPAAAEAMKARLRSNEFGSDAARALWGIWQREMGVIDNSPSRRPFGAAAERRSSASRRSMQEPHPYAVAIIEAATECCGETDDTSPGRALELFAVAARMPYGNRGPLLVDAARRFSEHRNVVGLLHGLAAAGEILDSGLLVHRCRTEWNALRGARWEIDREWWRVDDFLQLLPFSDDPTAVLGVFTDLGDLSTRSLRLSNLLAALRDSPDARADALLVELGKRIPPVTREHEWLMAISDRGSPAAARALADFAFEADEKPEQLGVDKYHFTKVLGALLEKHREVAEYLVRRLPELRIPIARSLVASALAAVADRNTVLALVEHEARIAPPGSGNIPRTAIEGLVTERQPDPSWPGAYSILPRSASALREELFTMALRNDARAHIAIQCLEYIDQLRHDYGRPDDEPRHPRVDSGRPWPFSLAPFHPLPGSGGPS